MKYELMTNTISNYQVVFDAFLARRAEQTKRTYRQRIKLFFEWAVENKINSIHQIDHILVEKYIQYLESLNYSPNTLNATIAPIKKFFDYLYTANLIQNNTVKLIRPYKIDRRALKTSCPTKNDIKKILECINLRTKIGKRDQLIITLLANTGIRRSELRNIQLEDINENIIQINGKGQRKRIIIISKELKNKIKEYISEIKTYKTKFLITSYKNNIPQLSISSDSISRILREYGTKANTKLTPHMLRVYYATELYRKATDISIIQRLMGHESINQTQRYIELLKDSKTGEKYILNNFL
ncbi:tyrosine-type recombinase/integrase [Halobacteriovorax sp. DPLXC-1]|uniref:tyrosine-type recombinase/integrase n=1 Tax=Halobacteriovorax sp. DPLXC-1 TaxID=3110771 RepID=UPI002FF2CDFB